MSCLYILEINPLSVISFANIFPHFVGGLFIFFNGFLCSEKAFKFNWVVFVYFCFNFHYPRRQFQRNIAVIYVKGCSVMFSSRSFIVSGRTFRSLIHLFLYMVLENVLISFFYM